MESRRPPETVLPSRGRLAGIDFGTVRIGVAVSDPDQIIASPLETYHCRTPEQDAVFFQELVVREEICGFVVGLPVHMSGDESQKSEEARAFGAWLGAQTGLPVDWMDERYTTAFARESLANSGLRGKSRKARLDKIAAQLILATYLESRPGGNRVGAID
ncbi:MAG: Holliday junction resolvase RuvX [Mariniblastus sp.]|nr:Holliday junction resolvase RuvX [Mariniblastus sp.]